MTCFHLIDRRRKRLYTKICTKIHPKKRTFKQDPVVVLAYVVLLGVLLSGFTSFGF